MTTEAKVILGSIVATVILLGGGIWLLSAQSSADAARLSQPLMGEAIPSQGRDHVPDGTKVDYSTNPPTSGPHYVDPEPAGIYDTPVPDGNLVHSLEHGAVILWYKSNPPASEVAQLKSIFSSVPVSKKIMVPRDSLDAPVALTSWGRLLKLQTIDESQIKAFMTINEDRGPEEESL